MPAVSNAPDAPALPAPDAAHTAAARPAVAPFVRATRALAVGSLLALVANGLAWELWLAPTGRGTLALKVLPMLLPLAGLLKYRLYTYRWVSLVVWLFFTEAAVRAYEAAPGWGGPLALLQAVLCVLLFVACTAHVRWRLKHKRSELQPHTHADAPPAGRSDAAPAAPNP